MKEYSINIEKKIIDDDLISILCGVTSTACTWCSDLDYDTESYQQAKINLIDAGVKERDICYEDVLLQMLKNGEQITFYDAEEDENHLLSWGVFIKGIERYMSSDDCSSLDIDEWDDVDFDNVIQYAFFGEIVFG